MKKLLPTLFLCYAYCLHAQSEINLFPGTLSLYPYNNKTFSGDYLMTVGIPLTAGKLLPLTSNILEITAE